MPAKVSDRERAIEAAKNTKDSFLAWCEQERKDGEFIKLWDESTDRENVMSRYILASVRADDDKPITEEWVISIGFDRVHGCQTITSSTGDVVGRLNSTGGIFINGRGCRIKTRQQLRALLTALGIAN